MANYERGVYEPSDEVRVFDGSEEEDDVEGSRLPLLIVLALLVLAMFAGVVWLAYSQGVARGRGETPVLTAAAGPERVAPQQAGGNNVPYQGFKIYEQPAPQDDSADSAAPPKLANAAPAVTPPPAPVAATPAPAPVVVAPKPAPVTVPPAAPKVMASVPAPKPAPAKPAAAPPKSMAALIQQANSTPVAEAPKPVTTAAKATTPPPAMKQAMIPAPVGSPATGAPRALGSPLPATPAPKVAAAAPAPAAAKPVAAGGSYVLQIGAYKSQADADAAWKTYKGKHAALLSGYSDDVQQADLGDKGTWYRLRVGGLSDKEVATALCDRLKADGGACILGK
jgi:cell division septation protein DedD